MNQEQTYDNCSYFEIHNLCTHIDEELMKDFINDLELYNGNTGSTLDASKFIEKAEEVNKKYCNTCTSFKDIRI